MLQTTRSSNGSGSDEVLESVCVEGSLKAARALDSVVNLFGHRIGPMWIVTSGLSIPLVEDGLVLFEALCLGIVDFLGKGDESGRRRRSVGGRHCVEDRSMV